MRLIVFGLLIGVLMTVAGCNTIHGMGKDVESVGKTIQKTSK